MTAFECLIPRSTLIGFFVDHRIRQPEFRYPACGSHHRRLLSRSSFSNTLRAVIAERGEVARHREAGPPPTMAMRLPFFAEGCGMRCLTLSLKSAATRFSSANRDRCFLDTAAACRLARTIAGARPPEFREDRFHLRIDHVGVAIAAFDQADGVPGVGVRRPTRPVGIDGLR